MQYLKNFIILDILSRGNRKMVGKMYFIRRKGAIAALTFLLLFAGVKISAHNDQSFIHLSVNDGLSQNTIFSIYQDSQGFMWFGTRGGGLNKYDGYNFHVYRNNPDDEGSLSGNTILYIFEDSQRRLWIGTDEGKIDRFDQRTGKFIHYDLNVSSDIKYRPLRSVKVIYEDLSGRIWVGSNENVYIYNKESDSFDPVMNDTPFPLKGTTSICEDKEGNFYFATWDRLIKYHPEDDSYDQLKYPPNPYSSFGGRVNPLLLDTEGRLWLGSPEGLKMVDTKKNFLFTTIELDLSDSKEAFDYVRTIRQTRDGVIWFGTQNGLFAYNPVSNELIEYHTEPNNPESLGHNSIYSIFEDKVGSLWIGTWSGLSILDKRKYDFKHYSHAYNDPGSLSNNVVSSFQETSDGTWIGTEQGGLNFLNNERTIFTALKQKDNDPQSLPSDNVKAIYKDSHNNLWVGTFNGGLSLYIGNGRFRNFLQGHSVYSIIEMPDNKLIIGGRTGLHVMDLKTKSISRRVFEPSSGLYYIESFVTALYKDSKERVWIGTRNDGLYLYDPKRADLKQFISSSKDTSTISSDIIISVTEDLEGNIWVGTYNGLNKYNDANHSFDRMSRKDELQNEIIKGLVVDDDGMLWLSTNTGIFSYNITTEEIRHFDYLDGLQSNEFNPGACYKNSRGELFFGGVKGFNVFHPGSINKNMDAPPIIITDLKLFNEPVVPGEKDSPLTKHISETDKIVLTHLQSSFSFEFVALNYLIPEKNNYAYILEGYENDWNNSGRMRSASYMNLKPGNYTFHVKGSNNDGVWNEAGVSIDIEVLAPIWATPLAFLFYTVFLTALMFGLIKLVKYRADKENELRLERAEKARIKDMNTNRLQYFTNISHEFRTPLTLISGPLDKLISGKYIHQSEYLLQLMKSNVNRMLRLVNQLLDFRKLENEKMPLRIQSKNMDKFLSQIVLGFEDMANNKMIELKFITDSDHNDESSQWFDVGILDKVIYNLLSNAFKFTPEQGIITVKLSFEGDFARIEISDTGIGIEQSKVQKIFDRYYSDSPDLYSSTGIGLSLSKRLIDLHKGAIEVISEKGKGANFIVTLPVTKESFLPDEILTTEEGFILDRPELDSVPSFVPIEYAFGNTVKKDQLILIVEDDPEMSNFLANHLSEYELLLAENGKKGFETAIERIPDIIISDVMMPAMNGIEFCKAVKKEYLTSHIPVILLTAKAAIDEKIKGIETAGADAYLEKPFDPDYLSAMIRNQLLQRKKLKEKFSGLLTEPVKTGIIGKDELFLQKINKIVMENITDLSFSVEQLLVEVGMSRSQLYRKFKAISDKNPSEYIRILRLQYACDLLKTEDNSISEVAYMSGFGNVSYFNTCFKRHFGVSPGKYLAADPK